MKLSTNSIAILKNFSAINQGIYIEAGNVIKTVSPKNDCLATATVPDAFPVSFGIYDLNEFLAVLSLHKDNPELEFDEYHVIIKGLTGRSKIQYRFTDKQMLHTPPDRNVKFPSTPDVEFLLANDDYVWINNAAKVLKSPNIAIRSDGNSVNFVTFDIKDDSKSTDSLNFDIQGNGTEYNMIYKTENFARLYPGDYNVKIAGASRVGFYKHTTLDLNYYMMFDPESTYG